MRGENNGETIQGLLENMGLSNYRFGKYASLKEKKSVESSLKKLISKGYVEEAGLGYKITQKGADWQRANYSKYADGGEFGGGGQIMLGDLVHVIEKNKSGVVTNVIAQGKQYTVKFVDGSKSVYDKNELHKILDDSDYDEYAKGGEIEDLAITEQERKNSLKKAPKLF